MLEHEVSSLVTAWHAIIVGSLLASLLSVFLALLSSPFLVRITSGLHRLQLFTSQPSLAKTES